MDQLAYRPLTARKAPPKTTFVHPSSFASVTAQSPAICVVLLDASKIYNTFYEAMQQEGWRDGLPTNALLVSGPSKTADIQVTLAYGAHGPKELVVLLLGEEQ